MKAAILIGGKGKRMGALAADRPKPLIEVAGRSIIDWQVDWLKSNGITDVVLLMGQNSDKVVEHAKRVSNWGINVEFVQEIERADTGGAVKCAERNLKDEKHFYIINGDTLNNMKIKKMKPGKYTVVMALSNEKSPYGVVKSHGSKIIQFLEKPILKNIWVNAGCFVATPELFDFLPERGNISETAWPKLVELGKMGCKKFKGSYWRDIGTPKDVEMATDDIKTGALKF